MELAAVIGLVFLGLMIGFVGLVLVATWFQVDDELRRLDESRGRQG